MAPASEDENKELVGAQALAGLCDNSRWSWPGQSPPRQVSGAGLQPELDWLQGLLEHKENSDPL